MLGLSKRAYATFLLVINSNLGRIFSRI